MNRSLRALVPVGVVVLGLAGVVSPGATASARSAGSAALAGSAAAVVFASKAGVAAAAVAPGADPASSHPSAKPPVAGYQQVSSAFLTDPAGQQTFGSVSCPTGTKVVGGGVTIAGTSLQENINSSLPSTDGGAWLAYVNNASTVDGSFRVYAVCGKQNKAYAVVAGGVRDNPSGTYTQASATCPSGTLALGGGGLNSSTSVQVDLAESWEPDTRSWTFAGANSSAGTNQETAYVVCGAQPASYRRVDVFVGGVGANSQSGPATAPCPSGLAVLSGGTITSGDLTLTVNSTFPGSSSSWVSYMNNDADFGASFEAIAICAKAA